VAGTRKFATSTSLNDPSINNVVAAGMVARVLKMSEMAKACEWSMLTFAQYGGTKAAGSAMGGEGCMIYAALEYEVESIHEGCDDTFAVDVERVCG
jgi:hypothetical protein